MAGSLSYCNEYELITCKVFGIKAAAYRQDRWAEMIKDMQTVSGLLLSSVSSFLERVTDAVEFFERTVLCVHIWSNAKPLLGISNLQKLFLQAVLTPKLHVLEQKVMLMPVVNFWL